MNTTAKIMIEEATMARDSIYREMMEVIALRGKDTPKAWLAGKASALDYYNTLLRNLGAAPAA